MRGEGGRVRQRHRRADGETQRGRRSEKGMQRSKDGRQYETHTHTDRSNRGRVCVREIERERGRERPLSASDMTEERARTSISAVLTDAVR